TDVEAGLPDLAVADELHRLEPECRERREPAADPRGEEDPRVLRQPGRPRGEAADEADDETADQVHRERAGRKEGSLHGAGQQVAPDSPDRAADRDEQHPIHLDALLTAPPLPSLGGFDETA